MVMFFEIRETVAAPSQRKRWQHPVLGQTKPHPGSRGLDQVVLARAQQAQPDLDRGVRLKHVPGGVGVRQTDLEELAGFQMP